MSDWGQAQKWEKDWWDNCTNTLFEEEKQLIYAARMGLVRTSTHKTPYNFDLKGKRILDIGGGPTSLLLKCINKSESNAFVIDPLPYPKWVKDRYTAASIVLVQKKGEDLELTALKFDEAWIYNVLEHTDNPQKVIEKAQASAKLIRLFEWVDTVPSLGHPHVLTEKLLNNWLRGEGKVDTFTRGNTKGKGYYGIFPT